jgi:DNA-binding NarL/FixJ family response regulator
MEPIKVLIADDHAVVREGLIRILKGHSDIEVVGSAEDGLKDEELVLAKGKSLSSARASRHVGK